MVSRKGRGSRLFVLSKLVLALYLAAAAVVMVEGLPLQSDGRVELDSDGSHVFPALRHAQGLFTVWVYPMAIPATLLRPLEIALHRGGLPAIKVYCISTQCMEQIAEAQHTFGAARISAERLLLKDVTAGTPLADFIVHHGYYKLVMFGEDYLKELTSAAVLALLLRSEATATYLDLSLFAPTNIQHLSAADSTGLNVLLSRHALLFASSSVRSSQAAGSISSSTFIDDLAQLYASKLPPVPSSIQFVNNSWTYAPGMIVLAAESLAGRSSWSGRSGGSPLVQILERYEAPSFELNQHYATFTFDKRVATARVVNSGDEMQGLSGLQFYPFIDYFVERDAIGQFKSRNAGERVVMFANGWFNDPQTAFPPSEDIDALLFSMYIGPVLRRKIGPATHAYFDKHAPIGARDTGTLSYLRESGHRAYFSACATLLMQPLPQPAGPRTKIVVVEMTRQLVEKIVPRDMLKDVVYFVQDIAPSKGAKERMYRFQYSYALRRTFASAKVVLTARIHTALPSVGMGVPVIFPDLDDRQYPGGAGGRTLGLTDFFHMVKIVNGSVVGLESFDWNNPPPNPRGAQRDRQRATLWNIIREREPLRDMALAMGIVPLKPSPTVLREAKEIFHFVVHVDDADFQLSMRRSIESVFRHHPNAEVRLHSASLNVSRFSSFREAGYDLHVVPINVEGLLTLASDRSPKIAARHNTAFKTQLPALMQSEGTEGSRLEDLYRLLVLYVHGGSLLDTDVILLQPVPASIRNAVAEEGSKMLSLSTFLRFLEGNMFLEQAISDLLSSFESHTQGLSTGLLLRRTHTSMPNTPTGCFLQAMRGPSAGSVRGDCPVLLLHSSIVSPFASATVQDTCFTASLRSEDDLASISFESITVRLFGAADDSRPTGPKTLCHRLLNDNCIFCGDIL